MLTLIALNGQDKGRVFQLNGESPELLGRQAPNIKLSDAQTSRQHAEILLQNNTWLIHDLDSTNGTWVNGQKIIQITELEVGDRIVLGRHQFRVSQISNLPAPTPQPKPVQPEPHIGHEDLADMGVDLSESLSADILEEDGELPVVSDDVLIETDDSPALPVAKKTDPPTQDDVLIDLDALLADDLSGDSGTAAPHIDEPDEPDALEPQAVQPPEAPAYDSSEEAVFDLDAMLEESPPAVPVDVEVEEPGVVDAADAGESIAPAETNEPSGPGIDVHESEQPQASHAPEQASVPDSLIDIDILAAAQPTGSLDAGDDDLDLPELVVADAPAESDQTPADAIDEILGGLSDELDEQPNPTLTAEIEPDEVGEDQALAVQTETEPKDQEAQQEESTSAPADSVAGIDESLLLSPDEQMQAVSSYRRSRIKTLAVLVVCLVVASVLVWFGYSFLNRTDTTTRPAERNHPTITPDNNAMDLSPAGPEVKQDSTPVIDRPGQDKTTTAHAHKSTPTPDLGLTGKTQAPSTAPAPKSIADPFVDVDTPYSHPSAISSDTTADSPVAPTDPEVAASHQPNAAAQPGDQSIGAAATQPVTGSTDPQEPGAATPAVEERPLALASEQPEEAPIVAVGERSSMAAGDLQALRGAIEPAGPGSYRASESAALLGARKIVYVVDASGSLVDSFPRVLTELGNVIDELPEDRAFTVIFFGSDEVTEVPPIGLRRADEMNKRHLHNWIAPEKSNITAWGKGKPLEALQRAFGYQPDEIVILSDNLIGRQVSQDDIDELIDQIQQMAGDNLEMIHVIQFFDRDPQHVLKRIADYFDGRYDQIANTATPSAQTAVDDPLLEP